MSRRNRMRKDRILEGLEIGIGQAEARKRLQYELNFAVAKLGVADVAKVVTATLPEAANVSKFRG